jgi:cystathionine beta-lyase family protein involved in aluminum resistance
VIERLLALTGARPEVARAALEVMPAALAVADGRNAVVRANVLRAFLEEGIAESDLAGTLGYGYDDAALARYESLLARYFGAERALARLSFASGTHAIVTALDACLPAGGKLVSATGPPYDTLRNAIVTAPQSLVERGVRYQEVAMGPAGGPDLAGIARASEGAAVIFVQRSRGYAPRRSLSAAECGEIAAAARGVAPGAVVLVDNCYGELVEVTEPTHHGVDAVMGSLIKNIGGGLAPGGGYVIGREAVVARVAARHYAPGLGSGVGSSLGFGRALVQGFLYAPLVVGECLAGLRAAAALFERLGFAVDPAPAGERYDVVQAVALGSRARVLAFARGLQRAMPLNARFVPEPGAVPGYPEPVVMAGGAFVPGATIELSCDAPLRPPYEMYLQGGVLREHVIVGALFAADTIGRESLFPSPAEHIEVMTWTARS